MELRALFGALSSQTGAFSPLNGPDARALSRAPGVIQPMMYLAEPFGGNLGYWTSRGVLDAPILARSNYGGVAPSGELMPTLRRPDPWNDPASQIR